MANGIRQCSKVIAAWGLLGVSVALAQQVATPASGSPRSPYRLVPDAELIAPQEGELAPSADDPSLDPLIDAELSSCGECGECADCNDEPWSLFGNLMGGSLLDELGITAGGWLEQGFTWNPDSPDNRFNTPILFNDRANEYQMNQLYFYLERAVDTEGDRLDVGGRADLLFGTDGRFVKALGLETHGDGTDRWNSEDRRFYHLAMPQLYAEVFAPVGNGLSFKLGHFVTLLGAEVIAAPDNFFYSHTYQFLYSIPFTHTGVLGSYNLTDNVVVHAGFTRGWDTWEDNNDDLGFLGGVGWTSSDELSNVFFSLHTGDEDDAGENNRTTYSLVASRKLTDRLTYMIEHNLGVEDDVADGDDAEWYGIANYLLYDINECWAAGLRFEWFRDDDGVRVADSLGNTNAGNYFGLTAGLNWKPNANIIVRPEVRWDWTNGGITPFDDASDKNSFTAAVDAILLY